MTRNYSSINRVLAFACLCVVSAIALLPLAAQAAPSTIPPVPTRPPTPTPTLVPVPPAPASASDASPDGSLIELQVKFPKTWSKAGIHWQDLWTVVQWQDNRGIWHSVEGWQGTLNEVQGAVGKKEWWVAGADLGKGPFRWLVYQSQGGGLFATSESFYLPANVGQLVLTEVEARP
ncbi:MAG: hypothetical protein GY832_37830 [Chloroflexi bacterium]|nr:hypothetical protein [Chloroflexota bacterium]